MTDDISVHLRALAKSGRLNHISVAYMNNGLWSASYRGVADADRRIVEHADPAEALLSALTGRKPPVAEKPKPTNRKAPVVPKRAAPDEYEDLL